MTTTGTDAIEEYNKWLTPEQWEEMDGLDAESMMWYSWQASRQAAEAELAALHAYIADLNTAQLKAEHEVRQRTLKECAAIAGTEQIINGRRYRKANSRVVSAILSRLTNG